MNECINNLYSMEEKEELYLVSSYGWEIVCIFYKASVDGISFEPKG